MTGVMSCIAIAFHTIFFSSLGLLSRQIEDFWEHGHGNETSEPTTSARKS